MVKNNISLGQTIRNIHLDNFEFCYTLFGNDIFLQDFLINELDKCYLKNNGEKKYYNMDCDAEESLFNELHSISLFDEKRIIIIREIKKIRSSIGRKEILDYITKPNINTVLVLISNEYDLKNSFLGSLSKSTLLIDVRPPFYKKMSDWIKYFLKQRNIEFTNDALENYIENYGDSITHVMNEIEKDILFFNKDIINGEVLNRHISGSKIYSLWQLQDCLGSKKLFESIKIINSLKDHGIRVQQIINNSVAFFQQLLFYKIGSFNQKGYLGINKIVQSRLGKYSNGYTIEEIKNLLLDLRKIDLLSKTSSLNDFIFIEPMIVRICKSYYV